MKRSMAQQSGFTLIEAMVSMVIVGTLAATSLQTFHTLRKSAYEAEEDSLMRDAYTAIEAARGELDLSDDFWFWVGSTGPGTFNGWRSGMNGMNVMQLNELMPGIRVNSDMRIWASYNSWCNSENMRMMGCTTEDLCCVTHSVQVNHCKAEVTKSTTRWNNGETWVTEWQNGGC